MKYGAERNHGRQVDGRGYFDAVAKGHPFADSRGRIKEHRLVKERELGRVLDPRFEVIHHKDGVKTNNHPSNLEVLSPSEHSRIHAGWKRLGDKWFKSCRACNKFLEVNDVNFYRHYTGHNEFFGRCIPCVREDAKMRARSKYKQSK